MLEGLSAAAAQRRLIGVDGHEQCSVGLCVGRGLHGAGDPIRMLRVVVEPGGGPDPTAQDRRGDAEAAREGQLVADSPRFDPAEKLDNFGMSTPPVRLHSKAAL